MLSAVLEKGMALAGKLSPVGLDCGAYSLKLCQVFLEREGVSIYRAASERLPEGVIESGSIRSRELLVERLRRLNPGRRCRAVLAIPGNQAILRPFTLPRMPVAELAEAVRWEAREELPLPLEEMVLDFQPLAGCTGDKQEVLVAAVRQELVDAYVSAAEEAGFMPRAVEVKPLALARTLKVALTEQFTAPGEVVCLVDIGSQTSEIVFFAGDKLCFARTIECGGGDFSAALGSYRQLSLGQAEKEKCEEANESRELTRRITEKFLREFKSTLAYFKSRYQGEVRQVVLHGGGARLLQLPDVISELFGIPAVFGNVLHSLTFNEERMEGSVPELSMSLGVSLGLALRGVDI